MILKKYKIEMNCVKCSRYGDKIITYQYMSIIKVGCIQCGTPAQVYLSRYKDFRSGSYNNSVYVYATQIGDP